MAGESMTVGFSPVVSTTNNNSVTQTNVTQNAAVLPTVDFGKLTVEDRQKLLSLLTPENRQLLAAVLDDKVALAPETRQKLLEFILEQNAFGTANTTNRPYLTGALNKYNGERFPQADGFETYGLLMQTEQSNKQRIKFLATKDAARDLTEAITYNRSTQILDRYLAFRNEIMVNPYYTRYTGGLSEKEKTVLVGDEYMKLTGQTIEDTIDASAHGNFVSGLYNGVTLGIARDKSNTELKQEILGKEQPRGSAWARIMGATGGAALTGAGVGAGVGSTGAGVGAIPGAAIGAGIAGGGAFIITSVKELWNWACN